MRFATPLLKGARPKRRGRTALGRRLALFLGLFLTLSLSACVYDQQRRFASLPDDGVWLALPMGSWLGTKDMGEPEGLAACLTDTCENRIAVGIFRLKGEKAARTEAELRDPQALVRSLRERDRRAGAEGNVRKKIDVVTEPFSTGGLQGFALSITAETPDEGEVAARVHGAAVGRREGSDLRVVLAVGDDETVVRAAVAQLVAEAF